MERKILSDCLAAVRETRPLVHSITNYVTVHDVANMILASGASPVMSDEPGDVAGIVSISGALNINIGTLNTRSIEAMHIAAGKAAETAKPILLDPVGAGATPLRTSTALGIAGKYPLSVIRGNISEILSLASGSGKTQGVDACVQDAVNGGNLAEKAAFAKKFAGDFGTVVAISGAIDLVANKDVCYAVYNGVAMMGAITGSGCMLSGLMAAFLAANPSRPLEAALSSAVMMGIAGEKALGRMLEGEGNATYSNRLVDAVGLLGGDDLVKDARYEIV